MQEQNQYPTGRTLLKIGGISILAGNNSFCLILYSPTFIVHRPLPYTLLSLSHSHITDVYSTCDGSQSNKARNSDLTWMKQGIL